VARILVFLKASGDGMKLTFSMSRVQWSDSVWTMLGELKVTKSPLVFKLTAGNKYPFPISPRNPLTTSGPNATPKFFSFKHTLISSSTKSQVICAERVQ